MLSPGFFSQLNVKYFVSEGLWARLERQGVSSLFKITVTAGCRGDIAWFVQLQTNKIQGLFKDKLQFLRTKIHSIN